MKLRTKAVMCVFAALAACTVAVYTLVPGGPIVTELVAKSLNCRQMPCFLTLDSLTTGFEWDKLYVFAPEASQQDVENVLHEHPISVKAGTIRLAFIYKEKLVHFEEEKADLTHANRNRVVFVLPKGKHFGAFPRSTVFNVSAGESGPGEYQILWDSCHLEQDGQLHTGPCPLLE